MSELQLSEPVVVSWGEEGPDLPARLALTPKGIPVRWNGWVCPYFDREAVDTLIASQRELIERHGVEEFERLEWDPRNDRVVLDIYNHGYKTVEHVPARRVDGVDYWPVGAYAWTWSIVP